MKKICISLFIVIAISTACQKSYTCTCAVLNQGTGGAPPYSTTKTQVISATSINSAQSKCNATASSYSSYSCSIQQ